jgi:hypothetical protein
MCAENKRIRDNRTTDIDKTASEMSTSYGDKWCKHINTKCRVIDC